MATELQKIIDPGNASGTDYTDYNAWEEAFGGTSAGNMISADIFCHAVGKCTNGVAQTAALSVAGWGQFDSAHYAWLDVDAAYKYQTGYPGATANMVRVEVFDAYNAVVTDQFVRYSGIAFNPTFTADYRAHIYVAGPANHTRIENCCFCGSNQDRANVYGVQFCATATALKGYLINNLFYDFIGTTSRCFTHAATANATCYHYNTTICSAHTGIRGPTNGKDLVVNCLAFGCVRDYFGTFAAGSMNNAYTTANGTMSTAGVDLSTVALSAIFFNAPAKNFNLLSTSLCRDAGLNLATAAVMPFTTDWRGVTRPSGAAWDIGCWEQQQLSAVGRVLVPMQLIDGLLGLTAAGGGSVWDLIGRLLVPMQTVKGFEKITRQMRGKPAVPMQTVQGHGMKKSKWLVGRVTAPAATVKGDGKMTRQLLGRVRAPVPTVKGTGKMTLKLLGRVIGPAARVKGLLVGAAGAPAATPAPPGVVIYALGRKLAEEYRKRRKAKGVDPTRRIIPKGRSVTYLE